MMISCWLLIIVLLCCLNGISSSSSSSNSMNRHLEETTAVVTDVIDTKITTQKNENNIDKGNDPTPILRTATGGFVHTIMVFLTIVSFIGNGAFMVYVFWLSK